MRPKITLILSRVAQGSFLLVLPLFEDKLDNTSYGMNKNTGNKSQVEPILTGWCMLCVFHDRNFTRKRAGVSVFFFLSNRDSNGNWR